VNNNVSNDGTATSLEENGVLV